MAIEYMNWQDRNTYSNIDHVVIFDRALKKSDVEALKLNGKVVGFSGKNIIYKFVYEGKAWASSLQRTSNIIKV
jgi:uncharacterized protein involved in tellurium resistance